MNNSIFTAEELEEMARADAEISRMETGRLEYMRQYLRRYRKANPDKFREYWRRYSAAHKDEISAARRRRYAERKAANEQKKQQAGEEQARTGAGRRPQI